MLHLFFGSFAAAGEQAFDLSRGVLEEGDFGFGDGEEDDTAGVSEEEGGAGVSGVCEDDFDGSGIRRGICDDFTDAGGDFEESEVERLLGVCLDDATFF